MNRNRQLCRKASCNSRISRGKSEHPLAKAIMERAKTDEIAVAEVTEFSAVAGNGLTATLAGKMIKAGNLAFVSKFVKVSDDMQKKAVEFAKEGKTPLFFAADDRLCGIIAVADAIKEDSPEAVRQLKNMGIRVVMLTGDNERLPMPLESRREWTKSSQVCFRMERRLSSGS